MEQVKKGDCMSRRQFVKKSAVTSVAVGMMAPHSHAVQTKSANDKLGIAVIGTGGRGNSHLSMLKHMKDDGDNIDIVAVCDIYRI